MQFLSEIGIVLILLVMGATIVGVRRRVIAIKNQIGRLSMTFLKIEKDLESLQLSLLAMAEHDAKLHEKIHAIYRRKDLRFADIVSRGTLPSEIMRGLEEPDIEDDPNYWSDDRLKKFGFSRENSLEEDALSGIEAFDK